MYFFPETRKSWKKLQIYIKMTIKWINQAIREELSKYQKLEINFKTDILKITKVWKQKEELKMNPKVENLKGKLIVSCQALPDEPLHSSFIMGRMALAAKQGGASGIRANTPEDIKEIKTQVDLPVIRYQEKLRWLWDLYYTNDQRDWRINGSETRDHSIRCNNFKPTKGTEIDEFFHEIKENIQINY